MTLHLDRHRSGLVGATVLLLLVGAVGGYAWSARSGESEAGSAVTVRAVAHRASATDHNGADVDFARSMTPHHSQAIEMARLARTRAGSTQVRTLAARIEAAQAPEIEQMAGWLRTWGEGDGRRGGSMDGMMSRSDMTSLAAERGAAFDNDFVTMMMAHHAGAIAMAHDELVDGRSAAALALATAVQVTQQAELGQMRTMLRAMSG